MDKFDKSLPMMLRRTLDAVLPKYRTAFKEHGVSEQQWRVLRVLWEMKTCTSAELADRTLLPRPSLVGIVDRMIEKDLVLRERSNEDRRIVRVSLTKRGLSSQKKLMPQVDAVNGAIIKDCDKTSWLTMMSTLQTLIDSNETD